MRGKFECVLPAGESLTLINHNLEAEEVVAHVMHDIGGGAWDGCFTSTLVGIDMNNVMVLTCNPNYPHKVLVFS